jgi:small GTP-binding protein
MNNSSIYHNENDVSKYLALQPEIKTDKFTINVVVCGAPNVGKSTMVIKYKTNKFDPFYITSISIEEVKKAVNWDGNSYTVNFYTIPGDIQCQKDYSAIYKEADFFIVCFDVTSSKTYDRANEIIAKEIKKYTKLMDGKKNVFVLANKVDLKNRAVNTDMALKACGDKNLNFYEVSVKNSLNVNIVFSRMLELYDGLLNKIDE